VSGGQGNVANANCHRPDNRPEDKADMILMIVLGNQVRKACLMADYVNLVKSFQKFMEI